MGEWMAGVVADLADETTCSATTMTQGVTRRCKLDDDGHKDHEWWGTGPNVLAVVTWGGGRG